MSKVQVSIEAFEHHDFDVEAFDHESHVYMAWLFVTELGSRTGEERFVAALKSLTVALGVPGKYHDTITRFYLDLIARRSANRPGRSWDEFRAENGDLLDARLLERHYSRDALASNEARERFVEPDLAPVDSAA